MRKFQEEYEGKPVPILAYLTVMYTSPDLRYVYVGDEDFDPTYKKDIFFGLEPQGLSPLDISTENIHQLYGFRICNALDIEEGIYDPACSWLDLNLKDENEPADVYIPVCYEQDGEGEFWKEVSKSRFKCKTYDQEKEECTEYAKGPEGIGGVDIGGGIFGGRKAGFESRIKVMSNEDFRLHVSVLATVLATQWGSVNKASLDQETGPCEELKPEDQPYCYFNRAWEEYNAVYQIYQTNLLTFAQWPMSRCVDLATDVATNTDRCGACFDLGLDCFEKVTLKPITRGKSAQEVGAFVQGVVSELTFGITDIAGALLGALEGSKAEAEIASRVFYSVVCMQHCRMSLNMNPFSEGESAWMGKEDSHDMSMADLMSGTSTSEWGQEHMADMETFGVPLVLGPNFYKCTEDVPLIECPGWELDTEAVANCPDAVLKHLATDAPNYDAIVKPRISAGELELPWLVTLSSKVFASCPINEVPPEKDADKKERLVYSIKEHFCAISGLKDNECHFDGKSAVGGFFGHLFGVHDQVAFKSRRIYDARLATQEAQQRVFGVVLDCSRKIDEPHVVTYMAAPIEDSERTDEDEFETWTVDREGRSLEIIRTLTLENLVGGFTDINSDLNHPIRSELESDPVIMFEDAGDLASGKPYLPVIHPGRVEPLLPIDLVYGGATAASMPESRFIWSFQPELLMGVIFYPPSNGLMDKCDTGGDKCCKLYTGGYSEKPGMMGLLGRGLGFIGSLFIGGPLTKPFKAIGSKITGVIGKVAPKWAVKKAMTTAAKNAARGVTKRIFTNFAKRGVKGGVTSGAKRAAKKAAIEAGGEAMERFGVTTSKKALGEVAEQVAKKAATKAMAAQGMGRKVVGGILRHQIGRQAAKRGLVCALNAADPSKGLDWTQSFFRYSAEMYKFGVEPDLAFLADKVMSVPADNINAVCSDAAKSEIIIEKECNYAPHDPRGRVCTEDPDIIATMNPSFERAFQYATAGPAACSTDDMECVTLAGIRRAPIRKDGTCDDFIHDNKLAHLTYLREYMRYRVDFLSELKDRLVDLSTALDMQCEACNVSLDRIIDKYEHCRITTSDIQVRPNVRMKPLHDALLDMNPDAPDLIKDPKKTYAIGDAIQDGGDRAGVRQLLADTMDYRQAARLCTVPVCELFNAKVIGQAYLDTGASLKDCPLYSQGSTCTVEVDTAAASSAAGSSGATGAMFVEDWYSLPDPSVDVRLNADSVMPDTDAAAECVTSVLTAKNACTALGMRLFTAIATGVDDSGVPQLDTAESTDDPCAVSAKLDRMVAYLDTYTANQAVLREKMDRYKEGLECMEHSSRPEEGSCDCVPLDDPSPAWTRKYEYCLELEDLQSDVEETMWPNTMDGMTSEDFEIMTKQLVMAIIGDLDERYFKLVQDTYRTDETKEQQEDGTLVDAFYLVRDPSNDIWVPQNISAMWDAAFHLKFTLKHKLPYYITPWRDGRGGEKCQCHGAVKHEQLSAFLGKTVLVGEDSKGCYYAGLYDGVTCKDWEDNDNDEDTPPFADDRMTPLGVTEGELAPEDAECISSGFYNNDLWHGELWEPYFRAELSGYGIKTSEGGTISLDPAHCIYACAPEPIAGGDLPACVKCDSSAGACTDKNMPFWDTEDRDDFNVSASYFRHIPMLCSFGKETEAKERVAGTNKLIPAYQDLAALFDELNRVFPRDPSCFDYQNTWEGAGTTAEGTCTDACDRFSIDEKRKQLFYGFCKAVVSQGGTSVSGQCFCASESDPEGTAATDDMGRPIECVLPNTDEFYQRLFMCCRERYSCINLINTPTATGEGYTCKCTPGYYEVDPAECGIGQGIWLTVADAGFEVAGDPTKDRAFLGDPLRGWVKIKNTGSAPFSGSVNLDIVDEYGGSITEGAQLCSEDPRCDASREVSLGRDDLGEPRIVNLNGRRVLNITVKEVTDDCMARITWSLSSPMGNHAGEDTIPVGRCSFTELAEVTVVSLDIGESAGSQCGALLRTGSSLVVRAFKETHEGACSITLNCPDAPSKGEVRQLLREYCMDYVYGPVDQSLGPDKAAVFYTPELVVNSIMLGSDNRGSLSIRATAVMGERPYLNPPYLSHKRLPIERGNPSFENVYFEGGLTEMDGEFISFPGSELRAAARIRNTFNTPYAGAVMVRILDEQDLEIDRYTTDFGLDPIPVGGVGIAATDYMILNEDDLGKVLRISITMWTGDGQVLVQDWFGDDTHPKAWISVVRPAIDLADSFFQRSYESSRTGSAAVGDIVMAVVTPVNRMPIGFEGIINISLFHRERLMGQAQAPLFLAPGEESGTALRSDSSFKVPDTGTYHIHIGAEDANGIVWFQGVLHLADHPDAKLVVVRGGIDEDVLQDADNDGMKDDWEKDNGLDPSTDDSRMDLDLDGLMNKDELRFGTDPKEYDTDGDGWSDGAEIASHTDPLDGTSLPTDTDSDWIDDGWESDNEVTEPENDEDGDGLNNLKEFAWGLDPHHWDTDRDGFSDGEEVTSGTDPLDMTSHPDDSPTLHTDVDEDTMDDDWERRHHLDPTRDDGDEDPDGDGLANKEEFQLNTKPRDWDTDGDGFHDGIDTYPNDRLRMPPLPPEAELDADQDGMDDRWERRHHLDPNSPNDAGEDADSDGLTNVQEFRSGTDPHNWDTDKDGFSDEVDTDPVDPTEHPPMDDDGIVDPMDGGGACPGPPEKMYTLELCTGGACNSRENGKGGCFIRLTECKCPSDLMPNIVERDGKCQLSDMTRRCCVPCKWQKPE